MAAKLEKNNNSGWHGKREANGDRKKARKRNQNTMQTYHTSPQFGHISTARAIMRTTMMVTVRNILNYTQ